MRRGASLLTLLLTLLGPGLAAQGTSQLFTIGEVRMLTLPRGVSWWNVAFDSHNAEYMLVGLSGDTYLVFQAVTTWGAATRDPVQLNTPTVYYEGAQIAASRDIANSQFSSGFMAVWAQRPYGTPTYESDVIYAQPIVTQGMALGTRARVSEGRVEAFSAMVAHSRTSRRFLVVWDVCPSPYDCTGRQVQARLIGEDAQPLGPVTTIGMGSGIQVAWNPATDEFGITWSEGFARVSAAGAVLSRLYGAFGGEIEVNSLTGHYLIVGGTSTGVVGTELNRQGRIVSRGTVSNVVFTAHDLAFNPVTGSFLMSGQNRMVELNGHGAPLSAPVAAPGCGGYVVTREGTPEWRLFGVNGATSEREKCTTAIGTNTRNGGTETRLGGCAAPDPFAASGGGFCEAGVWMPLGSEPSDVPQPVFPPSPTMTLTLQNSASGLIGLWTLDGRTRIDALTLTPGRVPDTAWQIVGTGDFNADGKPDIVWQHDDGWLAVWFMDGTTRLDVQFLTPNRFSDPAWRVRAVGDFNGDRRPDLVIQHTTMGWVGVWFMNGIQLLDGRLFSPAATDPVWEIAGAPDLNADGSPDLLFQHTDGYLAAWFMAGATRAGEAAYLSPNRVPHAAWRVRGVGDIDHDGRADLILQRSDTGELAAWLMDGITLIDGVLLSPSAVPDPAWKVVGPR